MKRHVSRVMLALFLLTALLLSACGKAAPSAPAGTEASKIPENAVRVSSVDELLAALAPNAVIVLQEGDYDLSDASDYGWEDLDGYYHWDLVSGGCELNISQLGGLRLIGQGEVNILAKPRYAAVLRFYDCWDVQMEGLTIGHTQDPGICAAGVLDLVDCENFQLENCRLFGCGALGLNAFRSRNVSLRSSRIDGCSQGAVYADNCQDLRLEDCSLCDCGLSKDGAGSALVYGSRCWGLALVNCEISGNRMQSLLDNTWSEQVYMLGCKVEQNRFMDSVFHLQGRSATVDQCSFLLRSSERYYPRGTSSFVQDSAGEDLISFDLDHMELARASYDGPKSREELRPEREEQPDGTAQVHVSSVEELLAAIAPNTTIYLAPGNYDLSSAYGYGGQSGEWYEWVEVYDGFGLQFRGIQGLHIVGAGREETLVTIAPRYAAVFSYIDCEDVSVSGLTAGHSEAPGYCSGDVLDFESCHDIRVEDCSLFGCGVLGISAWNCSALDVRNTEIYECSYGGASITSCWDVNFEGCVIRDCDDGQDYLFLNDSKVGWDKLTLENGIHIFGAAGYQGQMEAYG